MATVTNSTVANNGTGSGQSLEALRAQKEAVKKELKKYDAYFCKFYGRQPRCDAEQRLCPHRPLDHERAQRPQLPFCL